jgi:hypothetical protein
MRVFKGLVVVAALTALAVLTAAAQTMIPSNTVIPVTLDSMLSSETAKVGDVFYAHHSGVSGAGFPDQTRFTGRVDSVTKASSSQPGQIGVDFISAMLPSGATVAIDGRLTGLDSASVMTDTSGNLKGTTEGRKTNWKFIAYGAGAGLILGEILADKATLGAILGAAAGYLYGKRQDVAVGKNVVVPAGTSFGVLLEQTVFAAKHNGCRRDSSTTAAGNYEQPEYRLHYTKAIHNSLQDLRAVPVRDGQAGDAFRLRPFHQDSRHRQGRPPDDIQGRNEGILRERQTHYDERSVEVH